MSCCRVECSQVVPLTVRDGRGRERKVSREVVQRQLTFVPSRLIARNLPGFQVSHNWTRAYFKRKWLG